MSLTRCFWDVEKRSWFEVLKKGYNPKSIHRTKLMEKRRELGISVHTMAVITECMIDKTEEEKEKLAISLMEIVTTSCCEDEMIERAMKLR